MGQEGRASDKRGREGEEGAWGQQGRPAGLGQGAGCGIKRGEEGVGQGEARLEPAGVIEGSEGRRAAGTEHSGGAPGRGRQEATRGARHAGGIKTRIQGGGAVEC